MKREIVSDVMFFHGETLGSQRFTIAGTLVGKNELMLSIALCSEQDAFCKAKGRLIATGRLFNQRSSKGRISIDISEEVSDRLMTIFNDISSRYHLASKNQILKEFDLYHPKKQN